jgi:hypothetical protein
MSLDNVTWHKLPKAEAERTNEQIADDLEAEAGELSALDPLGPLLCEAAERLRRAAP